MEGKLGGSMKEWEMQEGEKGLNQGGKGGGEGQVNLAVNPGPIFQCKGGRAHYILPISDTHSLQSTQQ